MVRYCCYMFMQRKDCTHNSCYNLESVRERKRVEVNLMSASVGVQGEKPHDIYKTIKIRGKETISHTNEHL